MFDGLTARFQQDIATFKNVLEAHDLARALFEAAPTAPDPWSPIRGNDLPKTTWHIYDHCAAFTRLYAIYATYVDDLIEEYLALLPSLYATYDKLPGPVTTQHRLGLSTILGKIGESGAYEGLNEIDLVTTFSHGLTGGTPYRLITNAFYTDRQNYRLEVLGRVLGSIGIEHAAHQLSQDAELKRFINATKPGTATVHSELEQFIKRRNEAAHMHVTDVVATDEIKSTADFVTHVGNAIAALLSHAIITRQHTLGQLPQLGIVEEVAYRGFVVISHFDRCMIRPGDRLAFAHNNSVILATVLELQVDGNTQEELLLTAPTEVGIRFDRRIHKGARICALREQQTAPYQVLQTVEQRKEDFIAAITDQFRNVPLATDDGRDAALEDIDSTDIDAPRITAMTDTSADLLLIARLTFTAIVPKQDAVLAENDTEAREETETDTLQSTVSIPVACRITFDSVTALAAPAHATILIDQLNNGKNIVFTP